MEFVTVINRKKCKKIYKAIRKPIILFLLYFEIFFALFCCTVLFYPDNTTFHLDYSRIAKCYAKNNFWIFMTKGKFVFVVDRKCISQEDREKLRALLRVKLSGVRM